MKTKSLLAFLVSAVAMSGVFVSCDKDDDEGGSGKITKNSFYDIDGQRVKSVVGSYDSYRFYYDENGNLESLICDDESYEVSTNPFRIKHEYSDSYESMSGTADISLNSQGYISSVKVKEKYEYYEYDGSETAEGTVTITYNGNGQISGMSSSSKWIDYVDGEKRTETYSATATFTYSGSLLKKVVCKATCIEDGETANESDTYTFVYDSEYENVFKMYSPEYAEVVFDDEYGLSALALIGMFGNASSMLPDYIEHESYEKYQEDGQVYEEEDSDTHQCYYTFKANGAIKSADGYDYSYTTVDTRANDVVVPMEVSNKEKKPNLNSIMSKMMHHRKHKK